MLATLRSGPMSASMPSRRQFVVGAAALSLLGACGSDGGGSADGGADGSASDELSLVRFYGPFFAAGASARVPFGVSDADGILPADRVPDEILVRVLDPDGETLEDELRAALHADGLPRPYYAVEFTPEAPGFYDLQAEVDGVEVISQLQVVEADDPTIAARLGPGDSLPALETPTVDDPQGITPICTREPMCDLHDRSVAELLGEGPIALLVSTPAFCQTVICGPILDLLLDIVPDFPDVSFVHAEVYRNPSENAVPPGPDDFAPIIGALGLPYEPVFYVTDADGTIVERLDYIFDSGEMRRVLER